MLMLSNYENIPAFNFGQIFDLKNLEEILNFIDDFARHEEDLINDQLDKSNLTMLTSAGLNVYGNNIVMEFEGYQIEYQTIEPPATLKMMFQTICVGICLVGKE